MTFSPSIFKIKEQKSFKKRFTKPIKQTTLKFGNGAIIISQEGLFETKHVKVLKKVLKKVWKKSNGYKFFFKKKCWLSLFYNFPLSKKSKNARMGKGKGGFVRWIIKVKQGTTLIETKNLSKYRLNCIKKLLQKATQLKLVSVYKQINDYVGFSKKQNFFWLI